MKIISTDNWNRETVSDILVCENVNELMGKWIVDLLNNDAGEYRPRWYMLVPDDYRLSRGMEDLV